MIPEIDTPAHAVSWFVHPTGPSALRQRDSDMTWSVVFIVCADNDSATCSISSRGIGYPALYPAPNCTSPLDISNNFTFEVIDGVLKGDTGTSFRLYLPRHLACLYE